MPDFRVSWPGLRVSWPGFGSFLARFWGSCPGWGVSWPGLGVSWLCNGDFDRILGQDLQLLKTVYIPTHVYRHKDK